MLEPHLQVCAIISYHAIKMFDIYMWRNVLLVLRIVSGFTRIHQKIVRLQTVHENMLSRLSTFFKTFGALVRHGGGGDGLAVESTSQNLGARVRVLVSAAADGCEVDAVLGGAYFVAEAKILNIVYLYQSILTKVVTSSL